MGELRSGLSATLDNELAHLLALNREDQISAVQLARLDFLLEQRDRKIDEDIALLHCIDKHAA